MGCLTCTRQLCQGASVGHVTIYTNTSTSLIPLPIVSGFWHLNLNSRSKLSIAAQRLSGTKCVPGAHQSLSTSFDSTAQSSPSTLKQQHPSPHVYRAHAKAYKVAMGPPHPQSAPTIDCSFIDVQESIRMYEPRYEGRYEGGVFVNARYASLFEDGRDRLSKLDTSIQLSASKVDKPARQTLGMIALLPDGLNSSQEHIMRSQARIPNDVKLKLALTTSERRALIYPTGDHNHYQMLSPIRHFTFPRIPISTAVKYGLYLTDNTRKFVGHYCRQSYKTSPSINNFYAAGVSERNSFSMFFKHF
ncbi:hypothetical protein Hypma_001589 [Hypsizygus marmoreus]|uniref:Uncharacterized protein n=1 Tax=Hypsizygus marmoreus TaxID=39966 RepID=A0A369JA25_HYPMA|nr:hypothetical protein Hypma_001589 [Hypsizygus marmoreus]